MARSTNKIVDLPSHLADQLRRQILRKGSGERVETVRAVANRFGVSINTAGAAMAILAREGLIDARPGRGTRVREHRDSRHVGVMLDMDLFGSNVSYFWRRVTRQVICGLREHGYRTRLYAGNLNPGHYVENASAELLDDLDERRLSGMVFVWGGDAPEVTQRLHAQQIPYLLSVAQIAMDYDHAIRGAVRQLLHAERRKLAYVGWAPGAERSRDFDQFFAIFADELSRHGLAPNERWIRSDLHPNLPGAGWSEVREIWTAARGEKPDGLLIADDVLLPSAVTAIQELGIRVPDQLMVVTHANKGDEYRAPFPVWRMDADPDAYAQAVIEMAVARMRGESVEQQRVVLPLELIAPDSVRVTSDATGTNREHV